MSVRLRNGRWQIDYYPEGRKGRRVRLSLPPSVPDEAAARAIERELRQSSAPPDLPLVGSAVRDLFPLYLQWYSLHRAAQTYRDISRTWDTHLCRLLGQYKTEDISLHHINVYKRIRKNEPARTGPYAGRAISNRTITKELHYFSGFLRWAAKQGHIARRQWTIERLPYSRPLPQVLSFAEAVALIRAASPRCRVLLLTLYSLGLRLGEACRLMWDDVDLDNRRIRLPNRKGGRAHILPIASDWLHRELGALHTSRESPWVFPSDRKPGQPISDIRGSISAAARAAGINRHVNPHLLRHSLATALLQADVNLRKIQEILGHSSVSTTEWYTHVLTEHKREALSRLDFDSLSPPGDYK